MDLILDTINKFGEIKTYRKSIHSLSFSEGYFYINTIEETARFHKSDILKLEVF